MLAIYIIGVLLFGGYLSYRFGQLHDYQREVFPLYVIATIFWPVLIVGAIAIGPFLGLYMLGERNKDK